MSISSDWRRSILIRVGRRLCILGCASQSGVYAVVGPALQVPSPSTCGADRSFVTVAPTARVGTRIGITYFAGRSKNGDDAHLAAALTRELAVQLRAADVAEDASRTGAKNGKRLIVKLSEGGSFAEVDVSITGSVLREGSTLRSQVKLTRSSDGTVIWNGTKLRAITDLPILARLIAQEVATRIGARLAPMPSIPADSGVSAELYELLLRGTYLKSRYDPADLTRAVEDFDEAVKMKPSYRKSLKLRDQAELQLVAWGGAGDARESRLVAGGLLRRVLERQPEEAERLVQEADLEMRRGQSASACRLVDSAIDSDPRSAPAYALRSLLSARGGNIREAFGDAETVALLGRPIWGDALRAVATIRSGDTTSGRKLAQRVLATARARRGAVPFWDARLVATALTEARLPGDAAALLARVDKRDPRLSWIRADPAIQGSRRSPGSAQPRT